MTESLSQGEDIRLSKILIFAGTTEGRKLSEHLCERGIEHTVCVATEYGEIVLHENPFAHVHMGRMDSEGMRSFFAEQKCKLIVDATHPYAAIVTENIKQAVYAFNEAHAVTDNQADSSISENIEYVRLKRDTDISADYDNIRYFEDNEACAKALNNTDGNILLTTGSKELSVYCKTSDVRERLYVRVLPGLESISLCMHNDITGKHILALQGPFSTQLNEALIDQYGIRCLVTKKSGAAGGFIEKIAAAKNKNIPVYIVGQSVDIILGASRMIEKYSAKIDKKPYYLAEQIIPYLYEICADTEKISNVLILFSGDTGFYSGSRKLYLAIKNEISEGKLNADVSILPGISSVSYMAAAVGETYNDAYICSIHGVKLSNITSRISHHAKTFMLMSGVKDVNMLGHLLSSDERYGLQKCSVTVGYQLSYPDENISQLSLQECTKLKREGLYICMIKNPNPVAKNVTPQLSDAAFIREKVPMTKEEIRHVSICKLHLKSDSVLYDVGSGTGSIAVEAASLSDDMEVYAIEQKENAVQLITQNKEKHGLENIHVINAKAPDGMENLPVPTHAFIGGSSGNLKEIIEALKVKNPHIRIVINAISMETICEIKEILSAYDVKNEDIVQLQVSRSKQIGHYHLMQAENPVWICSFEF